MGVIWFAVASALCAVAPNIGTLIAARALQGVGGALLTPASLAIIQATFDQEDRARAIGTWSAWSGTASAIAPFVGGWLLAVASWRWIFLINVPLAAVVVFLAVRHIPESRDETANGRPDLLGAALVLLRSRASPRVLLRSRASPQGRSRPQTIRSARQRYGFRSPSGSSARVLS